MQKRPSSYPHVLRQLSKCTSLQPFIHDVVLNAVYRPFLLFLRTIQRLTAELKDLEAEQQKYAITWASRQEAFGAVVSSLEELGEKVKEEKSEQERKDALRDGDDEMGETSSNTATAVKNGDESGAEDIDPAQQVKKLALDPKAPTFEPSPLRREQVVSDKEPQGDNGQIAEDEQMEIDTITALENTKPRSRTTSTREEGEEGEEEESEATTS